MNDCVCHLVLHRNVVAGINIIHALWLPGTQTQLAVVTAEFVLDIDFLRKNAKV